MKNISDFAFVRAEVLNSIKSSYLPSFIEIDGKVLSNTSNLEQKLHQELRQRRKSPSEI